MLAFCKGESSTSTTGVFDKLRACLGVDTPVPPITVIPVPNPEFLNLSEPEVEPEAVCPSVSNDTSSLELSLLLRGLEVE
jgi:hypothetical protein